jgi:hypothetical protein
VVVINTASESEVSPDSVVFVFVQLIVVGWRIIGRRLSRFFSFAVPLCLRQT